MVNNSSQVKSVVVLAPVVVLVAVGRGTAVALRRGEPGCSSTKLLEGCKELEVASSQLVEQQRDEPEPLLG